MDQPLRWINIALLMVVSGCATSPPDQPADAAGEPSATATVSDPRSSTAATPSTYLARCNQGVRRLDALLTPIVADLVEQQIPYTQNPADEWRDCSGAFLRLSSALAAACPGANNALVAEADSIGRYHRNGDNVRRQAAEARSSRAIAQWYAKRGRFTPIYYDGVSRSGQAPAALTTHRNRIKPGAVLWFALSRPLADDGLSGLFEKRRSRGPHINHMGTVTAVERDADGNVVGFKMFHGRSSGKNASVTKAHFWRWPTGYLRCSDTNNRATCEKDYPPLGYWNQYLVGISTLLPEA